MKEIIVNGRKYDAETGQLLAIEEKPVASFGADKIHQTIQPSQTLNRKFVKRPEQTSTQMLAVEQFKRRHDYAEISHLKNKQNMAKSQISRGQLRRNSNQIIMPISRDLSGISKETKKPTVSKKETSTESYSLHPLQARAIKQMSANKIEKRLPTMAEIKENAIVSALNQMAKDSQEQAKNQKTKKRFWWFLGGFGVLAIIAGAGIYANLPQISAKMASAQAGISGSLPNYTPEGFSLAELPYFDGKSIVVKYRKDSSNFEIKQSESNWDSTALLENKILPNWGKDYTTYLEKGITIYRNSHNATWVNGGKLFEITNAEELSSQEISKIAVSF